MLPPRHFSFLIAVALLLVITMNAGDGLGSEPKKPTSKNSLVPSDPKATVLNSIGMKLVLIPTGQFLMGSPETERTRRDDELFHRVKLTEPFLMGAHEVTVGQFRKFVQATNHRSEVERDGQGAGGYNVVTEKLEMLKTQYTWKYMGWKQTDQHPVLNVTWNDADQFCKWLSLKEGKTYRLPREAEWEYACRAGTQTRFFGGDEEISLKPIANIRDVMLKKKYALSPRTAPWDDSFPFSAPVGSFKPNAFGLYDMHGNAWEWCNDWYDKDYYRRSPLENPRGPSTGSERVIRGGSWSNGAETCRVAGRFHGLPSYRNYGDGFRVVREP